MSSGSVETASEAGGIHKKQRNNSSCGSNGSVKKTKTNWNPFKKVLNLVKGHQSSTLSETSESDEIVYRWMSSCFSAKCPIFAKNPQFNMVYCVLPSLQIFIIIYMACEDKMKKHLKSLFQLAESDFRDLERISKSLKKLTTKNGFFTFVQFLVDEEKTTTVCKSLMKESKMIVGQQVFFSIRPSRLQRYLCSLCFSPVSIQRANLLTTNAYCSTGLETTWFGKARAIGKARFSCTYSKSNFEPFFELKTRYRKTRNEAFEIIQFDFMTNDSKLTKGSIIIMRPHCVGQLPYENLTLTTTSLQSIVNTLDNSKEHTGLILLPSFSVSSRHDLWKNLIRQGVHPDLGQTSKLPPIGSLWHWSNLSINENGIRDSVKTSKKMPHEELHGGPPKNLLFEKSQPYSMRIDSPFSYIINLDGIPVFIGSYFGTPPPKNAEMFMRAPERICRKKRIKVRKRRETRTRKQKLLEKIRKNKEKERAREAKEKKKIPSASSSSASSSAESTTTAKSKDSEVRNVFKIFKWNRK
ncbi:unnamed protein product [Caenorhabditis bovis]|uniref:Serpin domain-containing protein n=1 Tax=Caenorhabditis bovis TaxID=2654633 RepID=A0A8S1EIJ3_9PELO|nr:unnamed protein product [Caenorhabditis bovis]